MYMILLMLDDPARLAEVLSAWEAAGIVGATIIDSSAVHRRRKHLAMRYEFDSGLEEEGHRSLLAVVPSEGAVHECLAATEAIVGDLDGPTSGVFAAWPLAVAKGTSTAESRP